MHIAWNWANGSRVVEQCIAAASEFGGGPLWPQCNLNGKKKFKLRDMVSNGELAL